ncbi:hypothetical protein [Prosthecobacter dejongeii]|uniref:Uncharacterized protein n=1 Tax=Prosthecobacter dejongeii TaxID=48465 RepID=A0A7W8DNU9_9BACT|nr:hypothetical protein [Prosthecobacter dejongeii]MBB5036949.1 hypothetical protein [Prosthecobacter dejongeii]
MKTFLFLTFGGLLVAALPVPALAAEPPRTRPGLIIIQGPRPEIRRFLPVHPRPQPQGYPSGWLAPTKQPSKSPSTTGKSHLYSAYGQGTAKLQPRESIAPQTRAMPSSQRMAPPPTPSQPPQEPTVNQHPVATEIRPGMVKSPFAPHVPLDVQGLPSGALAKDPVSGKLFRVP